MPPPNRLNKKLVTLIRKKTKMKKEDVEDVLGLLPECMSQIFFENNPAPGEVVNFGFVGMSWLPSKLYGTMVHLKKTDNLLQHLRHHKTSLTTPLSYTFQSLRPEKQLHEYPSKPKGRKKRTLQPLNLPKLTTSPIQQPNMQQAGEFQQDQQIGKCKFSL